VLNMHTASNEAHVVVARLPRMSPCYLGPRSTISERQSRGITIEPPPPDQHPCSKISTHPRHLHRHRGKRRTSATRRETDIAGSEEATRRPGTEGRGDERGRDPPYRFARPLKRLRRSLIFLRFRILRPPYRCVTHVNQLKYTLFQAHLVL
jgi:hypothetical protein